MLGNGLLWLCQAKKDEESSLSLKVWVLQKVSNQQSIFLGPLLTFPLGYAALIAGSPMAKDHTKPLSEEVEADPGSFSAYFNKRLVNMLKGNRLAEGLPQLLQDTRSMLDDIAADPSGITNPFDSIYKIVFKLTMRTVGCNEIANDDALLYETLSLYEKLESAATPLTIMWPWIPTIGKIKRYYGGYQLYMMFKRVVDARNKEGRREKDALQYLLDQGDSLTQIITLVLGALFAGQLNSGVNAAWLLVYLANDRYWLERIQDEIQSVAEKYSPDADMPLKERLMQVPADAWEGEFPYLDLCLKDSIRLQLSGTAFRQNVSGRDIPLDKAGREVIPNGSYVTLAAGEVHYNPEIYERPDEWDPSRYMPERAEDKKALYGWFGWGVGRHPCLGMRFAKMEISIIVALFLAYFPEIKLLDSQKRPTTRIPAVDRNKHNSARPDESAYLQLRGVSVAT